MFGGSRARRLRFIGVGLLLIALIASYALMVSQRRASSSAPGNSSRAALAPTSSASVQFTPAPGITVSVAATPTQRASSAVSSSSQTGAPSGSAGSAGSSGSTGYAVPPRYPTPAPTAGGTTGGDGGSSPTATPSASSWHAGPTPTATPILLDDAQLVSFSPTGPIIGNNANITVNATFLNDGASTWTSQSGYALKCRQYCGYSWSVGPRTMFPVAPGQSMLFSGSESLTSAWTYSENTIIWQMWSAASGYFGQQISIKAINHGWYLAFQEASPSCAGDGAQWTSQGAGGTIACGTSGLEMAQGGSNGIVLDLHATPATYDPGNYSVKVHVHFTSASSAVFAGVVITEPAATAPSREVVMVSPAGYVCEQTNTAYCLPGYSPQPIPASSDYDIAVTVFVNGTSFDTAYSPGGSIEGGISAGGLTGLIEVAGAGVTDAAYFSNYRLYQYK